MHLWWIRISKAGLVENCHRVANCLTLGWSIMNLRSRITTILEIVCSGIVSMQLVTMAAVWVTPEVKSTATRRTISSTAPWTWPQALTPGSTCTSDEGVAVAASSTSKRMSCRDSHPSWIRARPVTTIWARASCYQPAVALTISRPSTIRNACWMSNCRSSSVI